MNKKTRLLIIITRMYAERLSPDNEFVEIFRQDINANQKSFQKDNRNILLIHGFSEKYDDKDILFIITDIERSVKACAIDTAKIASMGILFHPDADLEVDEFREAIKKQLPGWPFNFVEDYQGDMLESQQDPMGRLANKVSSGGDWSDEFDQVWRVFGEDFALEAKLELLHLCLTPKGAKGPGRDDFPPVLQLERDAFWNKKLKNLNPDLAACGEIVNSTVEQVVHCLSTMEDCFSDDYLKALTCLRDALLRH